MSEYIVRIKTTSIGIEAKDEAEAEEKGAERLIQLIKTGVINLEVIKMDY
jgi:hypothetical protein